MTGAADILDADIPDNIVVDRATVPTRTVSNWVPHWEPPVIDLHRHIEIGTCSCGARVHRGLLERRPLTCSACWARHIYRETLGHRHG